MTLQRKIVGCAGTPEAERMLFGASVAETLWAPVQADALLVPMALLDDDKAFRYGLISAVGGVCGGILAYVLGIIFFKMVGVDFFERYGMGEGVVMLRDIMLGYGGVIVLAAGFSNIPYRVLAVLAGFFGAGLAAFVMAALIARGARATVMVWLLWRGGARYKEWVERYFHGVCMVLSLFLLMFFVFVTALVKTS